jgi:hypothetical protein
LTTKRPFRRAISVDLVYVVRHSEENEALRYSLRSVARNLPHADVWVAGFAPSWLTGVRVVPTEPATTKWAGSTENLAAALAEPDAPETFVLMNDDFAVIEPVESVPVLHRGPLADVVLDRRYMRGGYGRAMRTALDMLRAEGIEEPLSYELHAPLPIVAEAMRETLARATHYRQHPALLIALQAHKRTLYGNRYDVGGEQVADVKVYRATDPLPPGPFVSTSPQSFNGRAGRALRAMFPDPSPYERSATLGR